ncbi:MAG: DUF6531 domain-containing protein, partial [Chromatiales bacterium]|nr:DUF6531 domain-containing protein [Chromatiales bacterium]
MDTILRKYIDIRLIFILVAISFFSVPLSSTAATSVLTVTSNPVTYWGWSPDPDMIGQKGVTIQDVRALVEARFPSLMSRENSYMVCSATNTGFSNNTQSVTANTYEQCARKSDGRLIFAYNYSYTFSTVRICPDGSSPDLSEPIFEQCNNKYGMEAPLFRSCPKEGDPCNPATGANFRYETDIDGEGLALKFTRYYSSKDYTASSGIMGENWQPVLSKTINRIPVSDNRNEQSVVKTELYETPESACTSGWNDIKTDAYRGLASEGSAVYDDGVCNIFVQGAIKASLPVINESNRNYGATPYVNGNVVTVTHSNGRQYLFHLREGQLTSITDTSVSLQQSSDGYLFIDSNGNRESYGQSGLLKQSIDPNGNSTNYEYDDLDRLISIVGPRGDELHLMYNMNSQIGSVSKDGETVSYTYESGHLTSVTYPDGSSKQYLYEDPLNAHSITGFVDENNVQFATWSYDDKGRVVMNEQVNGVNHYDFTYNADGSTTVTNSNNASRTYHFELVNGVVKVQQITGDRCDTCPDGGIKSYIYNENGFIESKIDWNGNTTTYTRDDQGRELSRTEASGTPQARTITTTWDTTLNKPLTVT